MHAEGCGFDPRYFHHVAIAQLAERLVEAQKVLGSVPSRHTIQCSLVSTAARLIVTQEVGVRIPGLQQYPLQYDVILSKKRTYIGGHNERR